jgi:conjugative transfer pilus assembly protein TraH
MTRLKKRHLLLVILHIVSPFVLFLIFICFFSSSACAGVNDDLNKFFDGLGFNANVTAPQAYKGQEAGYYTGGSIFARESVRNVQVAYLDLPSFRSGCGGIDLFAGGFSFINADQLVALSKNILNNAKGYAFTLAMESATPQISSVMKYLTDMQNKINSLNINSCETAAGLVGSLWPKNTMAQRRICEDVGTHSSFSIFSDMAAARQGCGAEGKMSDVLKRGSGSDQFKNMILDEGNIAWKAIKQNPLFRDDDQLAELFMSLSGTIIIRKSGAGDSASNKFSVLTSLVTDDKLLKAFLHGGVATIYKCDDTKPEGCLNPTKQNITINQKASIKEQVHTMLENMVGKIYADEKLSKQEIGLLQATSLPVYKMLNVQAAFQHDRSIIDVAGYSGIIATDILFQYLKESLHVIKASSGTLQYPQEIMTNFQGGINQAFNSVRSEQRNAYSQMAIAVQLIEQVKIIEQTLSGTLSTRLNSNIEWARNTE